MAETITLNYKNNSVTRIIGSKIENNPVSYSNKLQVLKQGFAEEIVTQRWLDENLITLTGNCMVDEAGNHIKHVARKTLDAETLLKFENEISAVAEEVTVI